MAKYKIDIEIDVDFEKIFSEIPEDLFSTEDRGVDEDYERECISTIMKETYLNTLVKRTENLGDELYPHMKHHIECELAVSKEIAK